MPYKIVLSEEAEMTLEDLRILTGREVLGDVVRDALTVYEDLVRRKQRGQSFLVTYKDGTGFGYDFKPWDSISVDEEASYMRPHLSLVREEP